METDYVWTQSCPTTGVLDAGLTPVGETLGPYGYAIEVTSRSEDADNDFGNYQEADLEVEKDGNITYTITVTNNGPSTAFNVVVDDDLPGNLTWSKKSVTASAGVVFDPADFVITLNHLDGSVDELAAGAWVEITVEAAIDGHAETPMLPNTATTSSDIPDPNEDNNSDDADIGEPTS